MGGNGGGIGGIGGLCFDVQRPIPINRIIEQVLPVVRGALNDSIISCGSKNTYLCKLALYTYTISTV